MIIHLFSDATTISLRSAFCGMRNIIVVGERTGSWVGWLGRRDTAREEAFGWGVKEPVSPS